MGIRYDDWDKKRYKTTRSMPWWHKHIRTAQCIGWAVIFTWAFGSIYRMLLIPPKEMQTRALDLRNTGLSDDANEFRKTVLQREKALYEGKLRSKIKEVVNS